MRKIYREIMSGHEWVVDADLRDFFGNVEHEALIDMIAEKTQITHISKGFEFLGYKVKQAQRGLRLPSHKIKKGPNKLNLYAIPTQKSLDRFVGTIRNRTKRRVPLKLNELIQSINPVIRGWGNYYRKAHVRKLFNKLQGWILRKIWSIIIFWCISY